jgi:methyl-accepting chemotaxis protein
MTLANTRIGTRLALGFASMIVLLLGVVGASILSQVKVGEITDRITDVEGRKLELVNAFLDANQANAKWLLEMFVTEDAAQMAKIQQAMAEVTKANAPVLAELEKLADNPADKAAFKAAMDARASYQATRGKIVDLLVKAKDRPAAQKLWIDDASPKFEAYAGALRSFRSAQGTVVKAGNAEIDVASARSRTVVLLFAGAAVLFAVGFAVWIARSITRPLGEAVRVAEGVAAGDLTARIEATSNDETGQLLSALGGMKARLREVIEQIRFTTEAVGTASKEIAQGNTDLSQRTEEQASSLEETASSMEELTATVKQNADNARQANQLAASASEVATKGGAVVGEVVTTMGAISASSKKIADIISVIDGIAFQTNILALNAAVEAARAGEQGRGFAVVASEVRSLAHRSAAAAKEIKELITDSVAKVDSGSALVEDAGRTMAEVVSSVKRVTDIMAEITAASLEQSSGIEQVNQAIVQMDQVTQQNAALVEESAAAAESMEDQARQLASAVAVFKVAGVAGTRPAARIAGAQAAAQPKPPAAWDGAERRGPQRAKNVARLPASAPGAPARPSSGAGVQGKKTGTDDEWAEF